jgi:hypothetical protein
LLNVVSVLNFTLHLQDKITADDLDQLEHVEKEEVAEAVEKPNLRCIENNGIWTIEENVPKIRKEVKKYLNNAWSKYPSAINHIQYWTFYFRIYRLEIS